MHALRAAERMGGAQGKKKKSRAHNIDCRRGSYMLLSVFWGLLRLLFCHCMRCNIELLCIAKALLVKYQITANRPFRHAWRVASSYNEVCKSTVYKSS